MPAEIEVKGQSFRSYISAVTRLFNQQVADRLVAVLPEDLRFSLTRGGIVAGGWYPVAWYRQLHAAAESVLPAEPQLQQRIGYDATRDDMQGIYRFVLKFVSPQTLLGQSSRIFATYARGGRVVVRENKPGTATLAYEDCHGINRPVWEELVGGTEATIDTTGVKRTSTTILDGGGNASRMVVRITWVATGH